MFASNPPDPGFGVYVHWPFCAAKCPYCDFNSHVRASVDHGAWARALVRELEHMAALKGPARVDSIFFGGGTPSLMEPRTVDMVIGAVARLWDLDGRAEITLEANPTSVDAERFAGYRAAGVNRVSLGVQSLIDRDLKFLGRLHTAEEARKAIALARETFPRMSFDLIYARPHQAPEAWAQELHDAIALAADHLSLYQLTIEEQTPFFELHKRGAFTVPEDDDAAALYEITQSVCAEAGLAAYEVSNHAAPGAESRHNLVYWRYGDYAGVGPGAHGRLTLGGARRALSTIRSPEGWLEAVEGQGHGIETDEPVSQNAQGQEFLLMGLRLKEGVSLARYRTLTGRSLSDRTLADLQAEGLLALDADRIAATDKGRPVLNAVIAALAES